METEHQASKSGEVSMAEKKTANGDEVVVVISGQQSPNAIGHSQSSKGTKYLPPKQSRVDSPHSMSVEFTTGNRSSKSSSLNQASPEIRFGSSPNKSPEIPTPKPSLTRRKSLPRSVYHKSKSRFGDTLYPVDAILEESKSSTLPDELAVNSPNNKFTPATRTISITSNTPKIPLKGSPGSAGEDEDEIIFNKVEQSKGKHKTVKTKVLIEWIVFACIAGCLVASLTVDKLKNITIRGLEFWKWCVFVMVLFCGMLVTNWFMHIIVLMIEMNFLLRKKVLYFVHGLKRSIQFFIWLVLVLLTWVLLINRGPQRSELAINILNRVTWTLVSVLVGTFLWLLKTLLLKLLATNFHVKSFFYRIQESICHQYVLQTLSGRPLIEEAENVGRSPNVGQFSFRSTRGEGGTKKEVLDMAKLRKMKQERVSAWKMKTLVDAVTNSGLPTISNVLDGSFYDGGHEQTDKDITNEMEATAAAYHIFRNVAAPGCPYVDEDDLLRFMIKEEVDLLAPLFEGEEAGRIDRKALTDWVVKVYQERKALAYAIGDTKTAVKQLNKLVTGILVLVTLIVWLLLMEFATTKVLVFLSSQLVLATFVIGNTCKNIFEAIIFVFVMHPFDVGDRCVIEGVQLLVEEMNILTTVFLKLDNEKVYYPNAILATKSISNYYRSPDMGDFVEFAIDFMTPVERIEALKEQIKRYVERNPQYWHPSHIVVVTEIENVDKIKIGLGIRHTMNFQEFGEKSKRRTELVMELKKIIEKLNIGYKLLPQAVHLSPIGSDTRVLASM